MVHFLRFLPYGIWKCICRIFFWYEVTWVNDKKLTSWGQVRIYCFLNHTSLWEALYISAMPFHFIWRGSEQVILPIADKTMNRPLVGFLVSLMAPKTISISRKNDETWKNFKDTLSNESIVCIAPEGRMLRKNGLDSKGEPMTIRGGIADILNIMDGGKMIIAYAGGLHHVQTPGEKMFRLFQKLKICYEVVDINSYKEQLGSHDSKAFKLAVINDLQERKEKYLPR